LDGGLGQILHDEHYWLNGRASPHLSEHRISVSDADTRRHQRPRNHYLHYPAVGFFFLVNCHFEPEKCPVWEVKPHGPELIPRFFLDLTIIADCFSNLLESYSFARY